MVTTSKCTNVTVMLFGCVKVHCEFRMRQLIVGNGKRVFAGARGSLSCLRLAIRVTGITVISLSVCLFLCVSSSLIESVNVLVFYSNNNNKAQSQEFKPKFQKIEEILHPIQKPSFSLVQDLEPKMSISNHSLKRASGSQKWEVRFPSPVDSCSSVERAPQAFSLFLLMGLVFV